MEENEEAKVTEGKVTVLLKDDTTKFCAFYNPAQELNRDLSIAAINAFMKFAKFQKKKFDLNNHKFKLCEPLSATGLRSLRYSLELDNEKISEIHAGDLDPKAIDIIIKNANLNSVKVGEGGKLKVNCADASSYLYSKMREFDIVDLDPYGTAVPFLDSAIQALRNGGLLCVTFTDLAVICGNYPETCYYKYGTIPFKGSFCHEVNMK